jgi:hypothetical protein
MIRKAQKPQTARRFTAARSQKLRVTKELRFDGGWPVGYVESFAGVARDFVRPAQGTVKQRRKR